MTRNPLGEAGTGAHTVPVTRLLPLMLALFLGFAGGSRAVAQEIYAAPAPSEVASWTVPRMPEDWDTVHGPYLRFHGEGADYATMLHLSRHAADSLPRLATELGVPIGDTIHVVVAPSARVFRELQPGNAPSWADGVAYPALGTIYLHAPRARDNTGTPLEKVLDHELVHVLLGRAFYPHPTPMWLQEGVAKVYAKEVTPDTTADLARGMVGRGLLSVTALTNHFPSDPGEAQLAYAQSADFIGYLRVEHGPEALPTLIRSLARGEDIDAAVHRATGKSFETVDRAWRDRLESGIPFELTAFFGQLDVTLLGLGGLGLVYAGVMRRRRFHQRIEQMAAEEAAMDALMAKIRAEEAERAVADAFHGR